MFVIFIMEFFGQIDFLNKMTEFCIVINFKNMAYMYLPLIYVFDFQPNAPQQTQAAKPQPKLMFQESISLNYPRTSYQQDRYYSLFREFLFKKDTVSSKKLWKQEEDDLLIDLNHQGFTWTQISTKIKHTNQEICERRHNRLISTRIKWPRELDQKICEAANAANFNWSKVYQAVYENEFQNFPRHSLKQIKQRYLLNLKPGIKKQGWTIQEDIQFLKLVNHFGTQWRKLSQVIPGRTQLQLKNRYYSILKPLEKKVLRKMNKR